MNKIKEPIIHSHVTGSLSEDHPLAYEKVFCMNCDKMVHDSINECMAMWVEGNGYSFHSSNELSEEEWNKEHQYCFDCYADVILMEFQK